MEEAGNGGVEGEGEDKGEVRRIGAHVRFLQLVEGRRGSLLGV